MTSIHETVRQSLQQAGYGQYQQQAQPVITQLVNREHEIVGRLIQFARQKGLSDEEARQAMVNCGMEVPPQAVQGYTESPAPSTAEPMTDDPVLRMLSDIQGQLQGLTQFARENGYSG